MSKFNELYEQYQKQFNESVIRIRERNPKTGKIEYRNRASRPGFKVIKKNGVPIEVRQSAAEARKRSKAAKEQARKRHRVTSKPAAQKFSITKSDKKFKNYLKKRKK